MREAADTTSPPRGMSLRGDNERRRGARRCWGICRAPPIGDGLSATHVPETSPHRPTALETAGSGGAEGTQHVLLIPLGAAVAAQQSDKVEGCPDRATPREIGRPPACYTTWECGQAHVWSAGDSPYIPSLWGRAPSLALSVPHQRPLGTKASAAPGWGGVWPCGSVLHPFQIVWGVARSAATSPG